MRNILTSGASFHTTDDIADALLSYTQRLAERGQTTVVEFPALVGGFTSSAKMIIGAGLPLATVTTDDSVPMELDGADLVAWDLRRRTDQLVSGVEGAW
jgi:hypothetical protein